MQKKSSLIVLGSLLFLVASCTSLSKIDHPVCVEISISKGYCTTIISGKGFYVSDTELFEGRTWFEQSYEMLRVPVSTWTEVKKYLIMNCKKTKSCNAKIDTWERSVGQIDKLTKVATDEESINPDISSELRKLPTR